MPDPIPYVQTPLDEDPRPPLSKIRKLVYTALDNVLAGIVTEGSYDAFVDGEDAKALAIDILDKASDVQELLSPVSDGPLFDWKIHCVAMLVCEWRIRRKFGLLSAHSEKRPVEPLKAFNAEILNPDPEFSSGTKLTQILDEIHNMTNPIDAKE